MSLGSNGKPVVFGQRREMLEEWKLQAVASPVATEEVESPPVCLLLGV